MIEVYAIYDKAVGSFGTPFYQKRRGEAIRTFSDAVCDPNSPFGKHPGDFALFYLGGYDDSAGLFHQTVGGAERVISAIEVMPASPE